VTYFAALGVSETECLNKANASRQVSEMDAEINRVSKNWNPSGYYQPSDVRKLLDAISSEASSAIAAVNGAPESTRTARADKARALSDLRIKFGDDALSYDAAVKSAQASGSVVDAPGFKSFVIRSMQAISDAYVTASVLHCMQTWIESVLDRGTRALRAIGNVAMAISGVALQVGQSVVKAAVSTAGILAATIRYAPYAALGVGAYMLFKYIKDRQ
jgi:hypothetical protein